MPAPGEQHLNHGGRAIINPFEETPPRISEYTAQEIATLQSRLERRLGPEYISSRTGPGGAKIHYLAAEKCIQLANEVFGFNGWSSTIKEVQVDFVDELAAGKVNLGLSVIVRVSLRDGTFHEDIGYGHIENCKGKAAAFEKAKKEGTTDALKRALRNFGNVLGNCIYDKDYLTKVTKIKVAPSKWDVDGLHRHSNYAPVKKEIPQDVKPDMVPSLPTRDSLDDEFGDFDEADFSIGYDAESHPDEVVLPAATSHHFNGNRLGNNGPQKAARSSNAPVVNGNGQSNSRPQSMQAPPRPQQVHDVNAAKAMQQAPQPQQQPQLQQPQTPTSANGYSRAMSAGNQRTHQQQNGSQARPGQPGPSGPQGLARPLYQPNRTDNPANWTGPPSAPTSPRQAPKLMSSNEVELTAGGAPSEVVPATVGFYSAKALPKTTTDPDAPLPVPAVNTLAAFNPRAESPSIRKTEGVDHNSSKPVNRSLKNVPGGTQQAGAGGAAPDNRTNIINPHLDATRRIGAPGSPSPLSNRGQYKPPTMKRPIDTSNMSARPPLGDMPINGTVVNNGESEFKRQRLNGA